MHGCEYTEDGCSARVCVCVEGGMQGDQMETGSTHSRTSRNFLSDEEITEVVETARDWLERSFTVGECGLYASQGVCVCR